MPTPTTPPSTPPNRALRRSGGKATPPRFCSAAELAEHYGICRASVYELMKRGMPSYKVLGARRFRLDQTDAWLDAHQDQAAA